MRMHGRTPNMHYKGFDYLHGYRDAEKAWHVYVPIPGKPSHFCGSFRTEALARHHIDELWDLGLHRLVDDLAGGGTGEYVPMGATP